MGLHRQRQFTQPGMPDFVAMFLLFLTVVPVLLWFSQQQGPAWNMTTGRVVSSSIRPVHYNAEPNRLKVFLSYEYEVDGVLYEDTWTGMWPDEGPNALDESQLESELQPGRAVYVFYDPRYPTETRMHDAGREIDLVYIIASLALAVLAVIYLVKIYPEWKF
jgi:hypothetical protein